MKSKSINQGGIWHLLTAIFLMMVFSRQGVLFSNNI